MLVAAAKINQSSIVPAFDQTRVPRIIQVPSGAAKFITEGFIICRWLEVPRNPFPPLMPTVHDCASQTDIVATFEVLQYDSGFTAMSSGVRVPSEFAVHTVLEIILDNHSQTQTHVRD